RLAPACPLRRQRQRRAPCPEQLQERLLRAVAARFHQLVYRLEVRVEHGAFLEAVQDRRPDVARLAYRRRVAELRRRLLDGRDDQLPAIGPALDLLRLQARQGAGGDQRPRPGAEVLGGEPFAHHFLDVV